MLEIPTLGSGTVSWNDQVDATRDTELRVTLKCYNENCVGLSFGRRVTWKEIKKLFPGGS